MPPLGLITLEIEGIKPEDLERLRGILHRLLIQGVLSVRPGSLTINFDHKGEISSIETKRIWRPIEVKPTVDRRVDSKRTVDTIGATPL